MSNRIMKILPVLTVFLLATLACNFSTGGPTPPPQEPTSVDAPTVEPIIIETSELGQVLITTTFTQEQLTDYLVQQVESSPDVPLSDPTILLNNGQGELYGKVQQGPITANLRIVFTLFVDANNRLGANILSANVGSVPLPSTITNQLTSLINQNLGSALDSDGSGVKVESVTIGDGSMTITGTKM